MTSPTILKQPFKVIEVPLKKFNDEAIPHHKQILEQHRNLVQKLITSQKFDELKKEIKDKKRMVRQIKDLMYELDTLRAQVQDEDLNKFDEKTFSLRRILTALIKDYTALQKQSQQFTESENQINENIENENPFHGTAPLQIQASMADLKLQEHEERLRKVEAIEDDVQQLHGICVDLSQMVVEQSEFVDVIETNVEGTKENVESGLKHLVKASKYKTVAYPVTGALVGTLVGGPVGLVAGFKVGGLAALSCGIAGYAGGRFFKKCNDGQIEATENAINSNIDDTISQPSSPTSAEESVEKKDK